MKTFLFLKFSTIIQFFGISPFISIPLFFLILPSVLLYFTFLIINILGLLKLSSKSKNELVSNESISVVVAIRNGEKSLEKLIKFLSNQDYRGKLEFILVDDESTDKTKDIIQKAQASDNRFKYVSSKNGSNLLKFKKRALDAGIKKSQNDILLFTDVDCELSPSWVRSMVSYFDSKVDYVIGFSRAKYIYGLANLFQRIDFLILMFSSAATCKLKYPLASSGQNQAFRKKLFYQLGGYNKISHLLMGDDSIFLQLCIRKGINVKFALNKNSFVHCRSEKNWKSLLLQRMRWAGDGKVMWQYNFKFFLIMCSTVIVNLLMIILPFFNVGLILLGFIALKFIFEMFVALIGAKKFDEKISFLEFIIWFCINIPYVVIMCLASFFVRFISWQGRQQKC